MSAIDPTSSLERIFLLTSGSAGNRTRTVLQVDAMVSSELPIARVPDVRRLASSGRSCRAGQNTWQTNNTIFIWNHTTNFTFLMVKTKCKDLWCITIETGGTNILFTSHHLLLFCASPYPWGCASCWSKTGYPPRKLQSSAGCYWETLTEQGCSAEPSASEPGFGSLHWTQGAPENTLAIAYNP